MTQLKKNRKSSSAISLDDKIQHGILFVLRVSVFVGMLIAIILGELGAFLFSLLSLLLVFLPQLIRSRVNIKLPIEYDFILVVFMYMAVFLGKVGGAYEHFWWWDVVLHTSSGFIISYVAFLMLYIAVEQKRLQASRLLIGLMIFSVGLAFGAIWEIFEYGLAIVFGGNLTAAGLRDTIQDLMVDGIGALIMAWFGVRHILDDKKGFIARLAENYVKLNPTYRIRNDNQR